MNFLFRYRVVPHIIFWVCIKAYEVWVYSISTTGFDDSLRLVLLRLPLELFITYFFILFLIPRYLKEKKWWPLIFYGLASIVACMILYVISRFYVLPISRFGKTIVQQLSTISYPLLSAFYFMPVPGLAIILKIVKELYFTNKKAEALQKANMQNEMAFLKAQIHPHFLFNTLNNLYGLSLHSTSDKTAKGISHLSDIMEYMLYDAVKDKVPVGKELHYITGFIELEKLRYGDRLQVSWDIDTEVESFEIAPLIFFTFVENAFKHGTSKLDDTTWITIYLHIEDNYIVYKVANNKPSVDQPSPMNANLNGASIGLTNLYKRLDLIYPGAYLLKTLDNGHNFLATLKIKLDHEAYLHNNR